MQRKNKQQQELNTLNEKINARKSYLLAQRDDNIKKLDSALKIATTLNIQNPTNISLLSSKNKTISFSADLNNLPPELYFKGKKLLRAEIEILKSRGNNMFIDDELRAMETQKILLSNNSHTKQLETERNRLIENTSTLTFYSPTLNAPTSPIASKKPIIIVIGIFLGGVIGLFLAIIKVGIRKYKTNLI